MINLLRNDIFCFSNKYLVANLVSRNIKLKYRKSALGFLWSLLVPLFTALTYYVVFQFVVRIKVDNYIVFIVCGLFPWTFVAQTLLQGMESIVSNHDLVSKVPLPYQVFPLTTAMSDMFNLLLSMPVVFGFAIFHGLYPGSSYLILPFLLFALFIMTYSLALILSIALVYLRDLRHLMNVGIQLWMYATPVLYPVSMIPPQLKFLLWANPMSAPIIAIRDVILRGAWPSMDMLGLLVGWTAALLIAAVFTLRMSSAKLVESM